MKILVACEWSGRVRDAFIAKGHNAISCDLLPTESPGPHYQGDVLDIIFDKEGRTKQWDMLIAFPPCTYLCGSGARWWPYKIPEQTKALSFVIKLLSCGVPKIVVENPVGIISTEYRKPDQIIQPWQFGHGETKATCLWTVGVNFITIHDLIKLSTIPALNLSNSTMLER
ncbi:DNA cytosine methyltransferase [Candidatus Pacearchaeota archaeon]|nr:DNA cytosine methyltransferase [Candidatus Pacearchaeota archaeon]